MRFLAIINLIFCAIITSDIISNHKDPEFYTVILAILCGGAFLVCILEAIKDSIVKAIEDD